MYPRQTAATYGIFVHRQMRELTNRGHRVHVVSPVPWAPPLPGLATRWDQYQDVPAADTIEGINVTYPRYVSLPGASTIALTCYSMRRAIQAACERASKRRTPDVINAHTALPDGFAAAEVARRFDTPLVTTIHGADFQKSINLPLAKRLMEQTFNRSDRTVVNSSKLERLSQTYFDNLDVTVVPNGVPISDINNAKTTTKPAEISSEREVLISVANLVPTKGHRFVLEAITTLENDVQYLIVGHGSERERLEDLVRGYNLQDDVVFTGRVPHDEVFKYLWHSDVFVLPSYEEAFGIAYIEAMACELPTIACRGEGPEDFIQHGKTGYLVPPKDASALADTIASLLRDPDERECVGERARKVVTSGYTWEINAKRIEELFQSTF